MGYDLFLGWDLRENLFNPAKGILPPPADDGVAPPPGHASEIRYLECGDRDTEIRTIAKQIKNLISVEGFKLA